MQHNINAWWSKQPYPGNFGDILTPFIFNKLSNNNLNFVHHNSPLDHILCVGSILGKATKYSTVWGSGVMKYTDVLNRDANYLAVRGPISRSIILRSGGKCPEIYGDPALLLPMLTEFNVPKTYDIGIIPHYVDYEEVKKMYKHRPDIKIINLLDADPMHPLQHMLSCNKLISSSLHGLIAPAAFGIPVSWVKFSNKLYGDGVKFHDFFNSVKVEHNYTEITADNCLNKLNNLQFIDKIYFNPDDLLSTCPFNDKFK